MKHLKRLVQSRPMNNRVPDQSLITSSTFGDTSGNHIRATRAANGAYAFIYTAAGQPFTINMTKLTGGTITATWYSPRTGQTQPAGTHPNTGTQSFTPPPAEPGASGNDWVLVLDDSTRGFGTPGVGIASPAPAPTPAPTPASKPTPIPAKPRPQPKPITSTATTTTSSQVFSNQPVKPLKKRLLSTPPNQTTALA
jgi:hypothetical protein